MSNLKWKDKTCERCIYQLDDRCHYWPPKGNFFGDYPVVYEPDKPGFAKACSKWESYKK